MLQIAGSHNDSKAPGRKQTLWSDFTYRRDNEIFGEAEPADYVYRITSGAVRTFKLLPDGRRQIGALHLPGDIFGIESGDFYRFTAEAIGETRVRIAKQERLFGGDLEASGFSSKELLRLIAGSLERAESHVLLLGRQSAPERVAAFLMEMDRRLRSPKILVLPMRRRDIADYLGLSHETVTRCFSTFRDRGVLGYPDISRREIVLHDRARLAQLAMGRTST
jgi:CRP/FNR family transcriptional regulator, nitrogen fixation regulation protein